MRGIIVILSIIVLAVGVGAAFVFSGPYVDAYLPRAQVGEPITRAVPSAPSAEPAEGEVAAVVQTSAVTYVPIILYPNGDAGVSQYALDFDVPIARDRIEIDVEGVALVPTDQKADYQGPAARYRIVLTRKLARKDKIVLVAQLQDPALANRITISPDSGLLGMLVIDFGMTPAQLDMAVTGARAAAPALVALLTLWIITALARLGSQPALSASDRVSAAPRRDSQSDSKAKEYKAERDFWREAVRQFLTDRRVDVSEADRMLDGIETSLKAAKQSDAEAPKRPLVAKRAD